MILVAFINKGSYTGHAAYFHLAAAGRLRPRRRNRQPPKEHDPNESHGEMSASLLPAGNSPANAARSGVRSAIALKSMDLVRISEPQNQAAEKSVRHT
jgi:hypothetical protein